MIWEELKQNLINSKYYYFHTSNGVLLCGDCLEVIKLIPDESIDLTVTSPPYDNLRYYSAKDERELEDIWNFEKFKLLAEELYRITTKGGVVVWIVGDATIKGSESGNSFRQALYFKDVCGFNLHDTMIYDKGNCRFPQRNRYYQCFEYMFVLSKGRPKIVNLIKDKLNNSVGHLVRASTARTKKGNLIKTCKDKKKRVKKVGVRFNIWRITPAWKTAHKDEVAYKHPATFPEQLAHDHIISWSNECDIVLDPLCGSGTTLKIAEKLSRRWIGIEINPEYCEISKERIQKVLTQKE